MLWAKFVFRTVAGKSLESLPKLNSLRVIFQRFFWNLRQLHVPFLSSKSLQAYFSEHFWKATSGNKSIQFCMCKAKAVFQGNNEMWNFCVTLHSKGPVDTVGGTVKHHVATKVM